MKVRRALLSVYDKTGVVDFARGLIEFEIEILATEGTASLLRASGVPVTDVSEITGSPGMIEPGLRTLDPKIHAGLLASRDDDDHTEQLAKGNLPHIDLVAGGFYPFEQTVGSDCTIEEAVAQIDIGGPALIRSAARNFRHVAVVANPRRYGEVLDALRAGGGMLTDAFLQDLARAAFRTTAAYDAAINTYLATQAGVEYPRFYAPVFEKVRGLRYGENPFQSAAVYADRAAAGPCVATGDLLWGKDLSFNNLLDMDAAMRLVCELSEPAAVVIKHRNPCGAAIGTSAADAFERAHSGDPLSAYGSVVGFNTVVDEAAAAALAVPEHFIECIVAPGFEPAAIQTLTSRTKWGATIRLLKVEDMNAPISPRDRDLRRILGGILVQEYDDRTTPEGGHRCVSQREPTEAESADLAFAWICAKHARSSAVVLVRDRTLVGVGTGQTCRVDATRLAVAKAGNRAKGAALASDAFFPFADGLEVALEAGVSAAIEPGGSRNDHEVIAAANDVEAALVFSGMRHFRH